MFGHSVRGLLALTALIALTACSAATTPAPGTPTPGTTPTQSAAEQRAAELAQLVDIYQLTDLPQVEPVRYVSRDEQIMLRHECMTEMGYPSDTLGSYSAPPGQEKAFGLAQYTCAARYPLTDRYYEPLNQKQLTLIYQHYTTVMVPCLIQHGYQPADPPTLETFLANLGTPEEYSPVDGIPIQSKTEQDALEKACPFFPPDEILYGES